MVPKGWEQKKLEELCSLDAPITYGVLKPGEYFCGGIPLLQIKDLCDGSVLSNGLHLISPELDYEYRRSRIIKNDILISLVGTIGRVAKYQSSSEANIHRNIGRIRSNQHEYLFHYLRSDDVQRGITDSASGSSQSALNLSTLRSMLILVPPVIEQKKIAKILSTWDKAISVTEKLLANSQQQKKALMQQLLTGKKRLLDENGVRFSGDWGKFTLSHFGKCIRGVSYKPENICENESDNTIRLLRSTNIQNGELNDKDLIILPKKLVKPMQVLMDGDLAICMANGSKSLVGKSAPYKPNDADYTVGAFCALFRPLKSVSSNFVKFLFESNQYQSQLLVILAGSSINNLKGSDIESINIDAPLHYKEQQKIAAVLSAADAEISTLEKKLACLRDEKKALMQQLLTGKRRVKFDEAVAV